MTRPSEDNKESLIIHDNRSDNAVACKMNENQMLRKALKELENQKQRNNRNLETVSEFRNDQRYIGAKASKEEITIAPSFRYKEILLSKLQEKINPQEAKFLLPSSYKLLVILFKSLDSNIRMIKQKKNQCFFSGLKEAVEQGTQRKFDEQAFRQILKVAPEFFIYKWAKRGQDIELQIDIPKNFEQEILEQIAKKDESGLEPIVNEI